MRKTLIALLLGVLLWASPASAAWSRVDYGTCANSAGASATCTTGSLNTTGADLLVAVLATYNIGTPAAGDLTDSKSNTWTKRANQSGGAGGSLTMFWTTPSSVGSGHTFTYARNDTYCALAVIAFSGSDTAGPFDQESAGAAPSSSTSKQPGSLTADTYLGITGLSIDGSSSGITIDSSFTRETGTTYNPGNAESANLAWKVFASGAENPTWSGWASAGNSSRMWTFKLGGGGGGPVGCKNGLLMQGAGCEVVQ